MRRLVLLVGAVVMLGLMAGSASAKGASPSCSVSPTTVPVGGTVVFSAAGLTGKNFLGVFEAPQGGLDGSPPEQVIPLGNASSVSVPVVLDRGPEMYILVVYNGNGVYSDNHFECWAFAQTS